MFVVYFLPTTISGAIQQIVPNLLFRRSYCDCRKHEYWKPVRRTSPAVEIRILSDLTSRCIIPLEWRKAMPYITLNITYLMNGSSNFYP